MEQDSIQPTPTKTFHWVNVLGAVIFSILLVPVILHLFFQISFSPVTTTSMQPEYSLGDLVFAKELLASEVKIGDVVVLRDAKTHQLFAHRVVKISESNGLLQIQTQGKDQSTVDPSFVQISPDSTLPKAAGSLPYAGKLIDFLSSKTGKLLSGIALILSAILYLVRLSHRRLTVKNATQSQNLDQENS